MPDLQTKKRRGFFSYPARVIVTGFLAIILLGGTLLLFPFSRADGSFASGGEILGTYFTAVSATCVTGLVVFDTGTFWSAFGQVIILLMIQTGGLGFMTMSVVISIIVRRKISPKEQLVLAQSLNLSSIHGIIRLMKRILIGTFAFEGAGAVILFLRFIKDFPLGRAIYYSIFHSVSAFCNAGFDLFGGHFGEYNSIIHYNNDYIVLGTFSVLIITGGIGFMVWDDFIELIKHKKRLSVYTRFVLIITCVLIVTGGLFFMITEYSNPATIGNMSFFQKLANSFFHSVTCRTAGFDAVGCGGLTELGKFGSIALMFIGGASGSTAGGIKVSTIGLLAYSIWRVLCGNTTIILFKRRISHSNVLRAMTIFAVAFILVSVFALLISFTLGGAQFIDILFETVSAFATVGLTALGTPLLSGFARALIMILMFFGRVGILTITYSLLERLNGESSVIKYPEAQILIG